MVEQSSFDRLKSYVLGDLAKRIVHLESLRNHDDEEITRIWEALARNAEYLTNSGNRLDKLEIVVAGDDRTFHEIIEDNALLAAHVSALEEKLLNSSNSNHSRISTLERQLAKMALEIAPAPTGESICTCGVGGESGLSHHEGCPLHHYQF